MFWKLLFFILIGYSALAQQVEEIDSLESLLNDDIHDSSRIDLLLKISDAHKKKDAKSAIRYASNALKLAIRMGDINRETNTLEKLASIHLSNSRYDSAILFYKRCAVIDSSRNNITGLARQHDNLGTVYYYQGDYPNTLKYFKNRLSLCEEIGDSSCISAANNNVGVVLINLGNYDDAIEYNIKSLEIDEKRGYQIGILSSKMSLGNIHFNLKNYDKSIEYYLEVIEVSELIGDQQLRISYAYNNIASAFYKQRLFKKAALYYENSLELEKEYGNESGIALKYNNLGSVYRDMGDVEKARDYYQKSLEIRQSIEDIYGLSSSKNNIAQLYLDTGQPTNALNYYKSALEDARKSGTLEQQKISYEGLTKSYKRLGVFKKALENHEMYMILKDSTLNEASAKQIALLEAKYENERKEREIEILNRDKELSTVRIAQQEAVVRQRSTQRNLLIAMIISISIISLLLLRNYRIQLKVKENINQKNKEFEDMRSSFFARISHEFRTPLTLISSPIDDLIKKHKDKETTWSLELVRRNAGKLLTMINQLLDLSKLEAGRLKLEVSKSEINSWIRICANSFESFALSKGVDFTHKIPDQPIVLFHDREKLEQVIENLLSNAFKFAPENGKVALSVALSNDEVSIMVTNEGTQIPEQELSKIFDRFYQTKQGAAQTDGSGIGLALVKEFSELHHGKVEVTSSEYGLTSFIVKIPISDKKYAEDLKVDAELSQVSKMVLSQSEIQAPEIEIKVDKETLPSLLIVEDNPDLRSYIQRQLNGLYETLVATNGVQGLEIAYSNIPDLIITDLMMPEMDGMEMLQELRNDVRTNHIPIIMLTAKAERENLIKGIEKGADHYVNKPFDIQEVKVRIKSLLDQRLRIRNHYHSEFISTPKAEKILSIDDKFLSQATTVIDQQLDNHEFSVDNFATELGMSRVQLHRKIKAIIGCSASEFMRHYRLKKAFQYLKGKKGSVSEIAYSVGFNNLSYFTKTFKEVYKTTPSELLK